MQGKNFNLGKLKRNLAEFIESQRKLPEVNLNQLEILFIRIKEFKNTLTFNTVYHANGF